MTRATYNRVVLDQRDRLKRAGKIVLAGVIFGLLYPILDKEFSDLIAFLNGFLIGLLAGIVMAAYEDRRRYRKQKQRHFITRLLMTTLLYTISFVVIILFVYSLTRSMEQGIGIGAYISGPDFRSFIFEEDFFVIVTYALVLSAAVALWFSMQRKVESKLLWNFVSGKYTHPREEERIFMFLDLDHSTALAESMQPMQFFHFLNEFYADITPAIMLTQGEIYRYVGDQIAVTWPLQEGLKNAKCIRAYFLARNEIKRQREKYHEQYQMQPSFTAAFHCGTTMVGEIGDVKSQIVFHGDVMYMTGIIEKKCKSFGKSILISSPLMERLSLPPLYKMTFCGNMSEEKTNKEFDLYTVEERTAN